MSELEIDREIGSRIRRAREEAGLSQQDLARRLGYSSSATVSYMEGGERRITVADVSAVSVALGMPMDYFLPSSSRDAASERRVSLRAEDIHRINPSARRIVVDFLFFVQSHGRTCSAAPDALRRKRPGIAAESILDRVEVLEPPVSPHDVAQKLGIPVFEWPFADDISGVFVCFETKTAIGVNERHSQRRQRFTVAHELGHYVYSARDAMVFDYVVRERGFSFETSETADDETKANQFAADLLMPADWLRKDFQQYGLDLTYLTRLYQVSEQAMWFRLLNLKLVPPSEQPT